MNLIANSGIQLYTIPFEINLDDNFKMYFHEWFDASDSQLKMEIAHYFSEEEIWVKKYDLTDLGYATAKDDFVVTENWETIQEDFEAESKSPIPIDTEEPEDSGCFQMSINRIKWEKFENIWYPMPFFLMKNNKSEFGPTNWCRFKLIPVEENGNIRKYNLLIAFDTRSEFEKETFEDEDLNETPVFTNNYEASKEFALCNNEYNLMAYCSKALNCDWVDKYVLDKFHNLEDINDFRGQKPKLSYLAQYIYLIKYIQQKNILPKITLYSNKNVAYGDVDLVVDIGNSRTCAMLFDNGDFNQASPLELQNFTSPVL